MKTYTKIFALVLAMLTLLSAAGAVNTFALECEEYYPDSDAICGDVDGDLRVTVKDATLIQKNLAKIADIELQSRLQADVNGDGKLSISDATDIQKYLALIVTSFEAYPVECCVADKGAVTIEIDNDFLVTVEEFNIYIPSAGYYRFTADIVKGNATAFYVGYNEKNTLFVNYCYADYDTLEQYAYIPQGYYRAGIYSSDYEDSTVNFSITSASEELMPLNPTDAKELNVGDKIEVKAGSDQQIYKFDADDIPLVVYTEGGDSNDIITLYSEALIMVNTVKAKVMDEIIGNKNVSYMVVSQAEGGSDYTICCEDYFDYIVNDAEAINLNDKEDIVFTEENLTSNNGAGYYRLEMFRKFTPAESGCYKLTFSGPEDLIVIDEQVDFDIPDERNRYVNTLAYNELEAFTVDYLNAGTTYLMKYTIKYETADEEISVVLSTADEQDYEKYMGTIDFIYEEVIPADAEEIALGEKTEVTLTAATDDEGWKTHEHKFYRFTADKDMQIVAYLKQEENAWFWVYDSNCKFVCDSRYCEDKNGNVAVAIELSAGESCFFEMSCYGSESDTIKYDFYIDYLDNFQPSSD